MKRLTLNKIDFFVFIAVLAVCLSGNFSPFKFLSINAVQLFIICYLTLNLKSVYYAKVPAWALIFVLYAVSLLFVSYLNFLYFSVEEIQYFSGSVNPLLYFILSFGRVFILVIILYLTSAKTDLSTEFKFLKKFTKSLFYFLSVSVFLQATAFYFFQVTFGFKFFYGDSVRFGSFIGEPQTLQSWISSAFVCYICLISQNNLKDTLFSRKLILLQVTHVITLFLCSSTVWIVAVFAFYIFSLYRLRLISNILLVAACFSIAQVIMPKISVDILSISERSITILAGAEIFTKNLSNIFVGYGLGMSPYLIISSSWFENFPVFLMSEFGRQTVMNSFFGLLFEVGILLTLPIVVLTFKFLYFGRVFVATFMTGLMGSMSTGNAFWAPSFALILATVLVSYRVKR